LLAGCWLWIGWAFHYQRYAQINWVAPWIAAAFALEALLLAAVGGIARRIVLWPPRPRIPDRDRADRIIVVGYPLLAPLTGRPWTTAEVFGVAADPTALVDRCDSGARPRPHPMAAAGHPDCSGACSPC
jgi:hypothetical protein